MELYANFTPIIVYLPPTIVAQPSFKDAFFFLMPLLSNFKAQPLKVDDK